QIQSAISMLSRSDEILDTQEIDAFLRLVVCRNRRIVEGDVAFADWQRKFGNHLQSGKLVDVSLRHGVFSACRDSNHVVRRALQPEVCLEPGLLFGAVVYHGQRSGSARRIGEQLPDITANQKL